MNLDNYISEKKTQDEIDSKLLQEAIETSDELIPLEELTKSLDNKEAIEIVIKQLEEKVINRDYYTDRFKRTAKQSIDILEWLKKEI